MEDATFARIPRKPKNNHSSRPHVLGKRLAALGPIILPGICSESNLEPKSIGEAEWGEEREQSERRNFLANTY